ncbi:MAG: protein NO VEIN domain-containing protein [Candidatus Kariarchaeaceae archaeon]
MKKPDPNWSKGKKGVFLVKQFFEAQRLRVSDVSIPKKGQAKGKHWDLEVFANDTKVTTIEVKTTSKEWFALPDLSEKQIIQQKIAGSTEYSLAADELWVVSHVDTIPRFWKLTKDDITQIGKDGGIKSKLMWKVTDSKAEKYAKRMQS